jgi:hypothetical protein
VLGRQLKSKRKYFNSERSFEPQVPNIKKVG